MDTQACSLQGLEASFKKLQTDKKKNALKGLEFILELNKEVGVDEILIREGFEVYPSRSQLQKGRSFAIIEAFFSYMVNNLPTIQENYLCESDEKKLIEQSKQDNPSQYNFLLNKNSISKFVRDEAVHYQNTIEKYLQTQGDENDKILKSSQIHLFIRDMFNSPFTAVIRDNHPLLDQPKQAFAVEIGQTLLQYGKDVKDIGESHAQNQFVINQQEVLDFLTFWLKQQLNRSLFVLYARTKQRIEQEAGILSNRSLKVNTHPSRMTNQELEAKKRDQQQAQNAQREEILARSIELLIENNKTPEPQLKPSFQSNYSALSLLRTKQFEALQLQSVQKQPKRQLTKEELLQRQMRSLFNYGCKRKYRLNKNSTFEDLQFELNNMNLEKFMYFCNFFELPSIISRDLIIDYFKLFATNHRVADFTQFKQIIEKLVKTDSKIIQNLLDRERFEVRSKRIQIRRNRKNEGKLSGYKFELRPVNGKDVTTMQKELTFRKLEKQIDREEKEQEALTKREKIQTTMEKKRGNLKSNANLGVSRLQISRFEKAKEPSFNPEKLLSFQKGSDDLWDAYEAKIYRRQPQYNQSKLQQILSKRINKGASIISKINSARSLLYE